MKEFITHRVDDEAVGDWSAIQEEAAKHRRSLISIEPYSEAKRISRKQRNWIKGVLVPYLMDRWGRSRLYVEDMLKMECGQDFFVVEKYMLEGEPRFHVSSIMDLTIKHTSEFMTNCLEWCEAKGDPIDPPDPNWRKRNVANNSSSRQADTRPATELHAESDGSS